MKNTEVKTILNKIEQHKREISSSKEASKAFLVKAGILEKNGKLSKNYKSLCEAEKVE